MTSATVRQLTPEGVCLDTGWIDGSEPDLTVVLPAGRFRARRAKSCLVAPDAGDRVLCGLDDDSVYVLAVLDGQPGAPTRLEAAGDVRLQAPSGRLGLSASKGVDVVGAGDVAISGGELSLRARRGSIALEELGFVGRVLNARVSKVSLVAEQLDTRLTRWIQRVKRAFRFVEDLEQLRAGTVDIRAERLAAVRADNTIIAARTVAKIDGEQVHIG